MKRTVNFSKYRIVLLPFVILVLLAAAAPAYTSPEAANRSFRQGLDQYLAGSYTSAISSFIEALKSDSSHRGAKAFILKSREKIREEQAAAERAAREQEILQRNIERERDREAARRIREMETDTAEDRAKRRARDHYMKGLEYAAANNPAMALREWDLSLLWEPENRELEGRVEKTRSELDMMARASILEKRIGEAYGFYQSGNLAESLDAWREVLRVDPGSPAAEEYIKGIENQLTKREREAYLARKKEQQKKEADSLIKKGSAALDGREYGAAATYFRKALDISPGYGRAESLMARAEKARSEEISVAVDEAVALFNRGEYTGASLKFHSVLQRDPENRKASEHMVKLRKLITEKERREREQEARRLYYEAASLYMEGKYRDCEETVEKILDLDPGNENAYRLLDRLERVRALTSR